MQCNNSREMRDHVCLHEQTNKHICETMIAERFFLQLQFIIFIHFHGCNSLSLKKMKKETTKTTDRKIALSENTKKKSKNDLIMNKCALHIFLLFYNTREVHKLKLNFQKSNYKWNIRFGHILFCLFFVSVMCRWLCCDIKFLQMSIHLS